MINTNFSLNQAFPSRADRTNHFLKDTSDIESLSLPIDTVSFSGPYDPALSLLKAMREARAKEIGQSMGHMAGKEVARHFERARECGNNLGKVMGEAVADHLKRERDQQTGKKALGDVGEALGKETGKLIGEARGRRISPILAPTIGRVIGGGIGADYGRAAGEMLGNTPIGRFVGDKLND